MNTQEVEQKPSFLPVGIAPNVSFKIINESQAPILVRNLDTKFANIVNTKRQGEVVLIEFGHIEVILPQDAEKIDGSQIVFNDFEFSANSSVILPIDVAIKLNKKLENLISKYEESIKESQKDE